MADTTIGRLKGYIVLDDQFSKKLDTAGKKMKRMGTSLLPLSAAFGAVGIAAVKMATDLNASMANVATLIPESTDRVQELKAEVQSLAVVTGKSTKDIAGGLYQVVSAYGDGADTVKMLEINAKAAAAGLATTEDAINLTSAVTKGYGTVSAEATQKAADLAFMTVKLGQTTFPELAGSMGRVIPIASALGVSQEEMFASFATLTGVVGDANETSTGLRATMAALLKPTDAMKNALNELGITSIKTKVEQDGLVETIRELAGTTDGSIESVSELFNNLRAQPTVLALLNGQAETFNQKLTQMGDASGAAAQAFKEQSEGVNKAGFEWKQMKEELTVVIQQFGDELIPIMTDFGKSLIPVVKELGNLVKMFAELPSPIKNFIVLLGGIVTAAGPVLWVMGSMAEGAAVLTTAIGMKGVGLIGSFGALAAILATGWAAYEFTSWVRDIVAPTEEAKESLDRLFLSIFGVQQGLDTYNRELEKGKMWGQDLTEAQKEALQKWIETQRQIGETTAALSEYNREQRIAAGPMPGLGGKPGIGDQFTPGSFLNDDPMGLKALSKDTTAAVNKMAAEKEKLFALSNEGIRAAVKEKEAQEMFAAVLELTGQKITDAAQARDILAKAEYNSAAAIKSRAEEAAKREQDALQKQLKAWEERDAAFKKSYDEATKLADSIGVVTQAQYDNAKAASQSAYALGHKLAIGAAKAGMGYDQIKRKVEGMTLSGQDAENILEAVRKELQRLKDEAAKGDIGTRLLDGFANSLKKLPDVIVGALQGGGDVWKSIGASIGGDLGQQIGQEVTKHLGSALGDVMGEKLGKSLGGMVGGFLGPLGSMAGSLLGDLFGGLFEKEEMQVNDLRDAFLDAHGGWEALAKDLAQVSDQDLVKKIFDATTVDQFNAAVSEVMGVLGLQNEAQEALNAAVERYGFTIEELGPKFRQQELDKQAAQLYQDFQLLTGSGISVNNVIKRMGPNLNEFLQTAIKTGATVPEAMRPVVEEMIKQGKLLDANGEAYGSVEEAGITFAQTMTEQFQTLIDKIDQMVNALLGIPTNVNTNINVNTRYSESGRRPAPRYGGEFPNGYPMAEGGIVSSPTMALIGEQGPEAVVPLSEMNQNSGPSADQVIQSMTDLMDDQRRMITRAIRDAMIQAGSN